MKRTFFFTVLLTVLLSCNEKKKELGSNNVSSFEIANDGWPKKVAINSKAQQALKDWVEYNAFETSFDALYTVANREDLSLVIENLIEKQNEMAASTYPEKFDKPQVKSRQKVFKTYMLKVKGDLIYRIDPNESILQMIGAYNAFRNQFDVIVNNTLDTKLILER